MGKTCNITIKIGAAYDEVRIEGKNLGPMLIVDRAEARKNKKFYVLDDVRALVASDIEVKAAQKKRKKWYKKKAKTA